MDTGFSLRMQTKIGLGLVVTSKLLRVAGVELEQFIWHELEANPALEMSGEAELQTGKRYLTHLAGSGLSVHGGAIGNGQPMVASTTSALEFDSVVKQMVTTPSVVDQLIAQVVLMVDGDDLEVAIYLLQSLDGHGYLRSTPGDLAAELNISTTSIERVVQVLHQLDPPGIGARDLHECLLIQCKHLEANGTDCTIIRRILTEVWDDFTDQRWGRVAQKLRLSVSAIEEARHFLMQNMYPYPLYLVAESSTNHGTFTSADMIIHRKYGYDQSTYTLEIPHVEASKLRVNAYFEGILHAKTGEARELSGEEQSWIKTHVDRARLFITALNQRWATLRRIGEYLIEYQVEFLNSGPRYLKPLTRATVAKALDLHESTVSRAINEKVVQLPDGRFMSLSGFFDPSLATKEALRWLLARTNTPLSDREIANRLHSEGLNLARRTIAKYRQELNIPPSYYR